MSPGTTQTTDSAPAGSPTLVGSPPKDVSHGVQGFPSQPDSQFSPKNDDRDTTERRHLLSLKQKMNASTAFKSLLPRRSIVSSVSSAGTSGWSGLYRVDVVIDGVEVEHPLTIDDPSTTQKQDQPEHSSASSASYFLKLVAHSHALVACSGEFESAVAIHRIVPEHGDLPVAWGVWDDREGAMGEDVRVLKSTVQDDSSVMTSTKIHENVVPQTYFFLTTFLDMLPAGNAKHPLPVSPEILMGALRSLHVQSTAQHPYRSHPRSSSPPHTAQHLTEDDVAATISQTERREDRIFGFPHPVLQGKVPNYAGPMLPRWTPYFTHCLRHVIERDIAMHGVWPQLRVLTNLVIERLIPRLIGCLEEDEKRIIPRLIHGDFWEGNTATIARTGELKFFDPATCWAHDEFELGNLRCSYNRVGDPRFRRAYRAVVKAEKGPIGGSEGEGQVMDDEDDEEWDDRNRLYCVYWNIGCSACQGEAGIPIRQMAYDDLYYLMKKYCPLPHDIDPGPMPESQRLALTKERDHTMS